MNTHSVTGTSDRPPIRPPGPVPVPGDLRRMLRDHLARRTMAALEAGIAARRAALVDPESFKRWADKIKQSAVDALDLGGLQDAPLNTRLVSRHEREHYVVENVIFESVDGWEVNGSVFIPRDELYAAPYPAIAVPCGHSTKTDADHQLPCQVFARAGFVAVTFDTPGQGTEKDPGNDHFTDGPRCHAVGQNPKRYFIADVLRALDYLSSREDVDASIGFAVTGVSGGGSATIWTALADQRVKVFAPVCCAAEMKDIPIANGYATCPEGFPIGRLRLGYDAVDDMAASAPTPQLYMVGEKDEVLTMEISRRVAQGVQEAYKAAGAGDKYEFYSEPCGHTYSATMARKFVNFAELHWLEQPDRKHAAAFNEDPELEKPEDLFCYPAPEPNMRTISAARAARLRAERPVLETVTQAGEAVKGLVFGLASATVDEVTRGDREQVWCSDVEELLFRREHDIFLPATALWPRDERPWPAVVMFDDRGRWAALRRGGWLARVSRHMNRDLRPAPAVLSVDLRGWGDSRVADTAYDLAAWSGDDRWTSYIAASLNDGLMGQRVRDAVAVCRWLGERPEIDPERIVLAGQGEGAVVALMTAAALGGTAGVVCMDGPDNIEGIVGAENYAWSLDIFQPGILACFDLPDLRKVVGPVFTVRSRDPEQKSLDDRSEAEALDWVWERMGLVRR